MCAYGTAVLRESQAANPGLNHTVSGARYLHSLHSLQMNPACGIQGGEVDGPC